MWVQACSIFCRCKRWNEARVRKKRPEKTNASHEKKKAQVKKFMNQEMPTRHEKEMARIRKPTSQEKVRNGHLLKPPPLSACEK